MKKYLITMDPGKKQDPAAVQVYRSTPVLQYAEPLLAQPQKVIVKDDLIMQYSLSDKRYTYLGRFISDLMQRKQLVSQTVLVFDATGVGEAVKDILYDQGIQSMLPIVYTAGGKVTYAYRDTQDKRFVGAKAAYLDYKQIDEIHVPKSDMVDAAIRAMEQEQVRLAEGLPYGDQFRLQLTEFTGKMNAKGYTSYNNSSEEIHDEWVNCFMMRSWYRYFFREEIVKAERPYTTPDTIADLGIFPS